jgi:hypothetical protein
MRVDSCTLRGASEWVFRAPRKLSLTIGNGLLSWLDGMMTQRIGNGLQLRTGKKRGLIPLDAN